MRALRNANMMMMQALFGVLTLAVCTTAGLVSGCADPAIVDSFVDGEANPFTDNDLKLGKDDSFYYNPDGIEVEVTVEADVTALQWQMPNGPAVLAQYAMTYLQSKGVMYLESIAEDASSKEMVEWFIDGQWVRWSDVDELPVDQANRFRIQGMNAVLLHEHQGRASAGEVFTASVPVRPFRVMTEVADRCAKYNSHITLSQSLYWYLWSPAKNGCDAELQDMTVTVTQVMPKRADVYPEYDRLIADGKVTTVVLFGQIRDGQLSDSDPGFWNVRRMTRNLQAGGYRQVSAPIGTRWVKKVNGITLEVDLYSPNEFKGLSDHANYANFEKAVTEHEIIAYDGHSMLGASDFWARPDYPDFYQVFLYGGCLGYQYYVRPIVAAKNGWNNVDIVSSVIAVSANATRYAGPFLAKLEAAIENNYDVTWKEMLTAIRRYVGDSTFGASGVRDNCFSPQGSLCVD